MTLFPLHNNFQDLTFRHILAGATICDEFRKALLCLCEEQYDLGASELYEYSRAQ
ncbi:MAG: hypothetical protein QGI24_00250 [Kiritimatiellia bacterium]|nr:hypothetical protein [Kiritimatiellia bacterium]MDP6847189.1 hypothetical protein [Kiritimatiellia bacterium]